MKGENTRKDPARARKSHEAAGDARCLGSQERLIRSLEAQWLVEERRADKAATEAAKPRGILGKLGFKTATG